MALSVWCSVCFLHLYGGDILLRGVFCTLVSMSLIWDSFSSCMTIFWRQFFHSVQHFLCVHFLYFVFCCCCCLIFQVPFLFGQDPLLCLWNLIFCLPLDLFCLYSFPFSFVVAKASQTRPEGWDPREVWWDVKMQGLGGEDTHQAGLWKRMWDVWVWYGVVTAAQRVVWVDACREDPGRSLDVGYSTRRGCEKRQGSLLKI